MVERITSSVLILLATFSVVMSNVIPHHHHHDEEVICIADDLHALDGGCEDQHSSDDSCCGLKLNLLTHFGDSRKEEHLCDCGTDFHLHDIYVILFSLLPEELTVPEDCLSGNLKFIPYSNTYLSAIADGYSGMRAPPIA